MRRSSHAFLFALLLPVIAQGQDLVPEWGGRIGAGGSDTGTAVELDAMGHIYLTGSFAGTVDFDPGPGVYQLSSAGSNDIYVAKFDTSGTLLWAKAMGGTYSDGATAIAVDAAGNVYTTGGFCGTADFDPGADTFEMTAATTGQNDIFVSKLDADGDFVWAKGVVGGTWWDAGYGIAVDPSGNVVITGRFYAQGGPRDFDPGPDTYFLTAGHEDIFVLKLDNDGDFLWAVDFGTAPHESRGYSIAVDADGNIFTTGYFRGTVDFDPGEGTFNLTSVGTWNVFYHKMDPDGNLVWVKSLPVTTTTYHNDSGYGRKIFVDGDNNLLATGRYSGTIDFDPDAGTTALTSTGDYDIYVTKYTNDGELVWAKSLGGTGYDEGLGITAGIDGSVYVTGTFRATADLDPGAGVMEVTALGADDMFLLRLNGNGDLLLASAFGGAGNDRSYALVTSASGAIYLTGWFAGTADLDPGAGSFQQTSAGGNDAFLVKLVESNGTGMEEWIVAAAAIPLYPNPANGLVNIICGPGLFGERGVIEVFDITGKRVHAEEVPWLQATQPLDLPAEWKDGLYVVMVRVEGQVPRSARLVVRQ